MRIDETEEPRLFGVKLTVSVQLPPAACGAPAQPVDENCAVSLSMTVRFPVAVAPPLCTVNMALVELAVPTSDMPQLPVSGMLTVIWPGVSEVPVASPMTDPPGDAESVNFRSLAPVAVDADGANTTVT